MLPKLPKTCEVLHSRNWKKKKACILRIVRQVKRRKGAGAIERQRWFDRRKKNNQNKTSTTAADMPSHSASEVLNSRSIKAWKLCNIFLDFSFTSWRCNWSESCANDLDDVKREKSSPYILWRFLQSSWPQSLVRKPLQFGQKLICNAFLGKLSPLLNRFFSFSQCVTFHNSGLVCLLAVQEFESWITSEVRASSDVVYSHVLISSQGQEHRNLDSRSYRVLSYSTGDTRPGPLALQISAGSGSPLRKRFLQGRFDCNLQMRRVLEFLYAAAYSTEHSVAGSKISRKK